MENSCAQSTPRVQDLIILMMLTVGWFRSLIAQERRSISTARPLTVQARKSFNITKLPTACGARMIMIPLEGLTGWSVTLTKAQTQPTGGGIFTRLGYNLRGQQTGAWGDIPFPCTNTYFEATDPSPELIGKLKQQTTYNGGASWSQTSWPGASTVDCE